eukprot:COSAG01_NODE_10908_length_2054_cov_1.692583_2_plen_329_part_00
MLLLSAAQLSAFEEHGFVTVDSTLTTAQVDAAEAAYDRLMAPTPDGVARHKCFNSRLAGPSYEDDGFVDTLSLPCFEAAAQQCLRSCEVEYIEAFPFARNPSPRPPAAEGWPHWGKVWRSGAHCDVQLTRSDWEATPRRDQLMMWLWLSDSHEEGGAMRVLPGSHLPIMDHWDRVLRPSRLDQLPRVHGLRPCPPPSQRNYPEGLPDRLGEMEFLETEPTALVARRGQLTVHSGALLHSAWFNPSPAPRKALLLQWIPAAVAGGLEQSRIDSCVQMFPGFHRALSARGKGHLMPAACRHFVSDYIQLWKETFVVVTDDTKKPDATARL